MSAQSANAAGALAPEHACRILVVDDEEPIRLTVSEILQDEGYPVALATNGAEALRCVESDPPCVVLLDMRMPILDGWGFLNALHARGDGPAILVMTAAQDARRWAEEVGADGYLAKPFDLLEVLAEVDRLCASRASEE